MEQNYLSPCLEDWQGKGTELHYLSVPPSHPNFWKKEKIVPLRQIEGGHILLNSFPFLYIFKLPIKRIRSPSFIPFPFPLFPVIQTHKLLTQGLWLCPYTQISLRYCTENKAKRLENIPWGGDAKLTLDEDRNLYIALWQHEKKK